MRILVEKRHILGLRAPLVELQEAYFGVGSVHAFASSMKKHGGELSYSGGCDTTVY